MRPIGSINADNYVAGPNGEHPTKKLPGTYGLDTVRGFRVSTVYLSVASRYFDRERSVFVDVPTWETKVFAGNREIACERYSETYDALDGHAKWLGKAQAGELTAGDPYSDDTDALAASAWGDDPCRKGLDV